MSLDMARNPLMAAASDDVDGAVGVSEMKWFVAIVNNRSEKIVASRLKNSGIDNYVATQTITRIWKNGRKAKVDHVVIPSMVFIKCTERQRRQIVSLPFINRFMVNKASGDTGLGHKPPAVIPDIEIEKLKFMLGQSDIPVVMTERAYLRGDRVRVMRGSLCGLIGIVSKDQDGKKEIVVNLDILGAAHMLINPIDLELLN